MNSCTASQKPSGCGPSNFGQCQNLGEMVDFFLGEKMEWAGRESAWWGDPNLSIQEACKRAMFTLENEELRDGHQWVFKKADLSAWGERVAGQAKALQEAADFDDLYRRIEAALGLDSNRKPLLVYDVARRLGYRFGHHPKNVYLHAGPKNGAERLKPGLGRLRSRPLCDFPTSIQTRLTPAQAEDFLCLSAKYLKADIWD